MRTSRRLTALLVPAILTALYACGGGAGSNAASSSGGAASGSTGTGGGTGAEGTAASTSATGLSASTSSASGGLGCASALLCGSQATCCATGDECVGGACVAPCPSKDQERCGATCCASGQICLSQACVTPDGKCMDSVDCKPDEFCEPTLGQCLPEPAGGPTCQYFPPPSAFAPTLKWSWTGSTIQPDYDQVLSVPLVADLDKDGIPDMVIVTHDTGDGACDTGHGYLRALDGKMGVEKWPATADAYSTAGQVAFCRTPAIADLDGDGKPEIIAHRFGGGLIAFHGDGSIFWTSTMTDGVTPYTAYMGWQSAIAVADMNGDGKPEVVSAGVIFDAKGHLVSGAGRENAGNNAAASEGGNSSVADVDGDGVAEILTGSAAYDYDGSQKWSSGMGDGYTAIADLDGDGVPELVVISDGYARVHDAVTGVLLAQAKMPGTGAGGPPTVADFNGDGTLDFASAVGDSYTIFSYTTKPAPAIGVIWSVPTADLSSSRTGSSVFDFLGNGVHEVLYNDECYMRIYDGKTGNVLLQIASSSGTAANYPIAVDVDGDHHTELVVISDDKYQINGLTPGCTYTMPGDAYRHGVFVYGDPNDKWVRTRAIWNEHSYHVTNIDASGTVPTPEPASWGPGGYDTYRVSEQGNGTFNAPDLTVGLAVVLSGCPTGVTLEASVSNVGSLGVQPGVVVQFYAGKDATGPLLGTATTTQSLLPGQDEVVTLMTTLTGQPPYDFFAVVNGSGAVDECNTQNNDSGIGGVTCPVTN